jgi:hypothetical protein
MGHVGSITLEKNKQYLMMIKELLVTITMETITPMDMMTQPMKSMYSKNTLDLGAFVMTMPARLLMPTANQILILQAVNME